MSKPGRRIGVGIALAGAALGLVLSATSTIDYVAHLDRQLHDIHCSFIPGSGVDQTADNACRTAMYSPYSAVLRDRIWGGIPISLFAVGAFSFLLAFALYLLLADRKAPPRAYRFFALAALTPVVASIVMAVISATRLGSYCKTCVGIYAGSLILAVGAIIAWWVDRKDIGIETPPRAGSNVPPTVVDEEGPPPRRAAPGWLAPAWLLLLGIFAAVPGFVYQQLVPTFEARIGTCGTLESVDDPKKALIHHRPSGARQPVVMVVDPLCPTCKAFHQRLVADELFDQLDTTLVLFPLDSECNWNLSTPLHPGACVVARAVICGEDRAMPILEWSYEEQDALLEAAKSKDGEAAVVARIEARHPGMKKCIESKETRMRLDEMIRFAVKNRLPVSTPQLFVGTTRLCDEDSDIGLPYTLKKLAPELAKR
jgi:uncharacterized membrane protein